MPILKFSTSLHKSPHWTPPILCWLLAILTSFSGGHATAQSRHVPPESLPVYRLTPVLPVPDDPVTSAATTQLFPDSQPPLRPFKWQSADGSNRGTFGFHSKTPPTIQLVNHQAEAITQTNAQVTEGVRPLVTTALVDSDAPTIPTPAVVEAEMKKVEQSTLTEEVKAAANKHHQQSIEFLRLADEASQKAAKLKSETEHGPESIDEAKKRLSETAEKIDAMVSPTASVAELEALRLADHELLLQARSALDSWEARARVRVERKPLMASLIEKTTKQLAEAREAKPAVDATERLVIEARKTEHESLINLLERQVNLYQTEQARYDALNELFPLQRDLASRTRSQLEKRSEFWKAAILDAGKRESVRQAAEARRSLQEAHPALRDLAKRNTELTEQRSKLQSFLAETRASVAVVRKLADNIETEFSDVKDDEDRVGLTTAMGILLRNQRSHLPDDTYYRQKRREAESEMARLQIGQLPLEDERKKVGDPAEQAELIVVGFGLTAGTDDIQSMAFGLLTDRRKYLDDLLKDYDTCIKDLAEFDIHCRTLVDTTVEFRNYVDARVLWIRSAEVAGFNTPVAAMTGLRQIFNSIDLQQIGSATAIEARSSTAQLLFLFGAVILLLRTQSRFRRWITILSKSCPPKSGPGFVSTAGALGLTLLIASVWPGLMWLLGRSMATHSNDEFLIACGIALKTTAIVFWSIEAFRQMCRSNGIAELHLRWPVETVRSLHSRLVGLLMAGLPFVFGVRFVESWNEGAWLDSLGRMIFVMGMCVLALSLRRIVRPRGPVFRTVLEENATGLMFRTRYVWSVAIVCAPLALAGLSIAGFQYTAEQLLIRVEATVWLFIALMAAFGFLMRKMHTARRKLAINQARQRRAATVESLSNQEGSGEVMPDVSPERTDFSLLSSQVLKLTQIAACVLFAAGAWIVWAEVLPALQIFDQVELWSTMTEVAEEVEIAEGVTKSVLVSRESPISLGSLILACGLLGLFVVASRNLPGLLELSVLQHIPMDDGGRNAISTLSRYALFATGIALSANMIGIGWSSVQWLLAALTVGLGFGLQEIFANFVSGLIILFERPVRIGDIVTIDNVSGKVSRIQIRATTITDFDRKEYIVPNKEFVTGRVLNWTLSDKTNRIKIEVGVGYGQDTMLARALLVKVARDNPKVLIDPEPLATFEGFGDSCLMLSLRCFIPGLDDRLQVITDLHEAIDREFRKQDLEIAFPQRDIHIRTMAAIPALQPVAQPHHEPASQMDVAVDLNQRTDRKAA